MTEIKAVRPPVAYVTGMKQPLIEAGAQKILSLTEETQFVPNGIVSRSGEARTLFRSGAGHSDEHRLTTAARIDAALKQSSTDNLATNAEFLGDSLFRHAGEVTLNKVIDVEIVSFHGPVYNLHTDRNFYAANGIIAHNCRCTMVPIVDTDWAEMQAGG